MCGKRLKVFLLLLGLSLQLPFVPLCWCSYADVILTDTEAEELMSEIQQSRKELENVKTELTESQKALEEQKVQLEDVKNTYSEQKTSYEMQLTEAEKKNQTLKTCLAVTVTTSVIFTTLTIVLLIL